MANINSQNVSKAEEALQLAYKDLISFGKLFLPDDFMRSETPFFHYEIADAIDDKNIKQTAIIVPRGHGKTVLTKASIIKDFVFATKENEGIIKDTVNQDLINVFLPTTPNPTSGFLLMVPKNDLI